MEKIAFSDHAVNSDRWLPAKLRHLTAETSNARHDVKRCFKLAYGKYLRFQAAPCATTRFEAWAAIHRCYETLAAESAKGGK